MADGEARILLLLATLLDRIGSVPSTPSVGSVPNETETG